MLDKVRAPLQAKIRHRRIMRAALQLVGDQGERTTSPVDLIALSFGSHAIEITAEEALRFLDAARVARGQRLPADKYDLRGRYPHEPPKLESEDDVW
ncbi:hypothetical protein [Streptomyces sp. DSM 40907]|uniref:hypothetical protein n=1 Tax=Streptomyces kutzneri TaxID=3051179 RepID=UPI0028D3D19D|nr:hypothetical protein [Streptomyces sp. DSM 40907]